MPKFDQTGPLGEGPLTGRGFGPCKGGSRAGFGRGRRFGRSFYQGTPRTKQETIEDMQEYKKALQEEIEDIDKEIGDLQKQD
jgi:hypothetical protein